ncbi:MAG: hypothetical protein MAGBODY4_01367 [Candidatus Marinimicrobia bacterium]|nr:hypothetical protein [Candidatus Neomarinimicrobiota bacterium]
MKIDHHCFEPLFGTGKVKRIRISEFRKVIRRCLFVADHCVWAFQLIISAFKGQILQDHTHSFIIERGIIRITIIHEITAISGFSGRNRIRVPDHS